jgi:hypothetical protein
MTEPTGSSVPRASRAPFLVGFTILVLTLAVFALLRWQAAIVAVGALGFPLLLVLALGQANHRRRSDDALPVRNLVLTAASGAAAGAGWALLISFIVARSYSVGLGEGTSRGHTILEGFTIPTAGAVVMLLPAVAIRLLCPAHRKLLHGMAIGALSAVSFTAASTLTLLAPQFAAGTTDPDRPIGELLAEAAIHGAAMPVTAAALGALTGAALWFSQPVEAAPARRRTWTPLVTSVLVTLVLYLTLGLTQVFPLSDGQHFALHALVAVLAVAAAKFGVGRLLPHVAEDRAASGAPPHPYRRLLLPFGAGMAIIAAAAFGVSAMATPGVPRYVCPPDCGRPPLGEPVHINPWFKSTDDRFLVQYPRAGTAYTVTFDPDGLNIDFTAGDTGTLQLFGLPAEGRAAQRIAEDLIHKRYPDVVADYEIPNALVGYEPGYGVVSDVYPRDPAGKFSRLRLVVMVAVKNGYALVAAAAGPYHEFTRDFGNGHPSAVDLQLALDMGKYVNSFIWRDPPSRH